MEKISRALLVSTLVERANSVTVNIDCECCDYPSHRMMTVKWLGRRLEFYLRDSVGNSSITIPLGSACTWWGSGSAFCENVLEEV